MYTYNLEVGQKFRLKENTKYTGRIVAHDPEHPDFFRVKLGKGRELKFLRGHLCQDYEFEGFDYDFDALYGKQTHGVCFPYHE